MPELTISLVEESKAADVLEGSFSRRDRIMKCPRHSIEMQRIPQHGYVSLWACEKCVRYGGPHNNLRPSGFSYRRASVRYVPAQGRVVSVGISLGIVAAILAIGLSLNHAVPPRSSPRHVWVEKGTSNRVECAASLKYGCWNGKGDPGEE